MCLESKILATKQFIRRIKNWWATVTNQHKAFIYSAIKVSEDPHKWHSRSSQAAKETEFALEGLDCFTVHTPGTSPYTGQTGAISTLPHSPLVFLKSLSEFHLVLASLQSELMVAQAQNS